MGMIAIGITTRPMQKEDAIMLRVQIMKQFSAMKYAEEAFL